MKTNDFNKITEYDTKINATTQAVPQQTRQDPSFDQNLSQQPSSDDSKYNEYADSFNESNDETNAYYDMIKEQKFDKLLDKEVQLENAKSQALKNTKNVINANGFGSQGYGSSAQSAIYGRYMNAFNENQRDYENDLDEIEMSRKQALKDSSEEAYQQVVALMSSGGGNMERVNNYLSSVGLGSINNKGDFVFGEKPQEMSQSDWTQLQYLYNLQNDSAKEMNGSDSNVAIYNSLDSLKAATYVNNEGKVSYFGNDFQLETARIWHEASVGNFQYGDSIKMTNNHGNIVYMQWTKDGFVQIKENDYNASARQFDSRYLNNGTLRFTQVK